AGFGPGIQQLRSYFNDHSSRVAASWLVLVTNSCVFFRKFATY
ncbi:unnamed protein product, partial [Larinioides sclopetarius]